MAMTIEPLGETMAAEVTGVDLAVPVDNEVARAFYQALVEHMVLCIRDQDLTPAQYGQASHLFGAPKLQVLRSNRLEEAPEVSVVSNTNEIGGDKPHVLATYWHTDDSYLAVPAKATMLYARELPSEGGDTQFINCHAVLEAMPEALRQQIEGRRAVHVYRSRRAGADVAVRTEEEREETPDVVHSLIRTHPESGRQALYINPNRIERIDGMDEAESDTLLDELYEFAFQDRFQYHHKWRLGDVVIWDNRCTVHRAMADFDVAQPRVMLRVLLEGTVPV